MHFQVGNRGVLPLESDYQKLRSEVPTAQDNDLVKLYMMPPEYGRMVIGLQSNNQKSLTETFTSLYEQWQIEPNEEPMMNVVCSYQNDQWQLLLMPRMAFRPVQYGSDEVSELLISPATVEMGGVIITPIKAHFDRVTAADIMDIYSQVSM